MASLSLYPQFETNLMSNRKVIELLLRLYHTNALNLKSLFSVVQLEKIGTVLNV